MQKSEEESYFRDPASLLRHSIEEEDSIYGRASDPQTAGHENENDIEYIIMNLHSKMKSLENKYIGTLAYLRLPFSLARAT